jgi:putative transposase
MVLKIRESGTVQRRALYLALGVTLDGDRDVLGTWFQETEGGVAPVSWPVEGFSG